MPEGKCIRSLTNLEVINLCDGKKIGYVRDVEIDITTGKVAVLRIMVDDGKCLSFGKAEEILLPFCKVERLGEDVILCTLPPAAPCFCNLKKKKGR